MKKQLIRKRSFPEVMTDKLFEKGARDQSFIATLFPSGLMVLAALLLILFGAVTYASTDEALKISQRSQTYCDDYYMAETVATEILADFAENSKQMVIIADNRSIYNSSLGEILVLNTGTGISFTVPIDKREELVVIGKLTEGRIQVVQWTIESAK